MTEVESPSLGELFKQFLAKVLSSVRAAGVIDNAGLFKKYPQNRLFEAYKEEPKNRARLLAANSAMPTNIAEYLDVPGCIQVFDIALNQLKEATPDKVFEVVTAEELVRLFDNRELWEFVEATKWYETDSEKHRELVRTLLAACKELQLGGGATRTLHVIEDAIGIDTYVEHLPKAVLTEIIRKARDVNDGKGSAPGLKFTVDALAEVAGTDVLSKHLPLPTLVKPIHGFAKAAGWIVDPPKPAEVPPPPAATAAAPTGEEDDERTPTTPPPAKKGDGDDGEPIVEIGKADGGSAPSDPDDDAELEALLAAEKAAQEAAAAGGSPPDGQPKALELDDEDDERTTVGRVPVPPPTGGKPPPLPPKGQQGGRQRGH